jgi:hypothetical protein
MLYLQNNIHYVQRHRAIKVNKITVHKKIRGSSSATAFQFWLAGGS